MTYRQRCPVCVGNGFFHPDRHDICPVCHGRGEIIMPGKWTDYDRCHVCVGNGFIDNRHDICEVCNGLGVVRPTIAE